MSVTVQFDVPARMRDGVTLMADVYRPAGDGPWPTLLTRTPYDKSSTTEAATLDPIQAARGGFMVVVQDTRGRLTSEGEWKPLWHEREDGYDTVEWAASLPGSSGKVGMYGESYCGNTQWMAAIERPPSLSAISPALTWCDPRDGLLARGGAIELGLDLPWTLLMGVAHLERLGLSAQERSDRVARLLEDYDRLPERGYWDLPVREIEVLRRHGFPDLGSIRSSQEEDAIARCSVNGMHERVLVPTLHTAAWYDIFTQGVLDNYTAMAALGRPAQLIVGPWTHVTFADPIADLCFGVSSGRAGVSAHPEGDANGLQLAWLRRQLEPERDEQDERAPVRIFVMGANRWREEDAWPLTRARTQRWHLASAGSLQEAEAEPGQASSEFTYDPADPVPTLGGQLVMAPAFPAGPFDQAPIEARADVCVFTSEPLQRDLEVTGRVRVVLHVESSAPATDWVARLCDVHPDGRSFNICDGITRLASGAKAPREVEIDLWSTSNVFLAGHRLRVQVTSSCFPRWDRNLNTGRQHEPRFQTAHQRIHHGSERASWIDLPVVD